MQKALYSPTKELFVSFVMRKPRVKVYNIINASSSKKESIFISTLNVQKTTFDLNMIQLRSTYMEERTFSV